MTAIQRTMVKIIDMPTVFLLVTVGVFLILVFAAAVIYYILACTWNKKTDMTGVMNVDVTLNVWHEADTNRTEPVLHYGKFQINMKEPAGTVGPRFNAPRNWKEKIQCRQYDISLFTDRFLKKYKMSGLSDDPSAQLLGSLLDREEFCRALGTCFRRNAGKGIQAVNSDFEKKSVDRINVYCDLSGGIYGAITGKYAAETGCSVRSICVALDYWD